MTSAGISPGAWTRRRVRVALAILAALLLWAPLACVLWTYRPYYADLLAMTAGYVLALYLPLVLVACGLRRWRLAGYILAVMALSGGWVAYRATPMGNPAVVPFTVPAADGSIVIASLNAHGDPATDQNRLADWVLARGVQVLVVISAPTDDTVLRRRLVAERGYRCATEWVANVYVRGQVRVHSDPLGAQPDRWPLMAPCFEVELSDGRQLRLLPVRFYSPRSVHDWNVALRGAVQRGARAAVLDGESPIPVIAPHDDNSTPVGRLYQAFAVASGFCDAQASVMPHGTWPAVLPPWASLSIDHIWLSRKLLLVDSGVGPDVGTLHRPVWARVGWQR
jgi:hypothetical protein